MIKIDCNIQVDDKTEQTSEINKVTRRLRRLSFYFTLLEVIKINDNLTIIKYRNNVTTKVEIINIEIVEID